MTSSHKNKNRRRIITGVLLLLMAAATAAWFWRNGGQPPPVYREVSVTRGDIELTILSTGVVQPKNRLEIKAPIAGRAEQVLVDQGSKVRKGQILAWMSSTERAALLDAARARGVEEVQHWEELYRPTPILAPLAGTLITRSLEAGQTFTGADAVFVMSDYLIVNAQVDETDLAHIRLRQPTTLVLDAYPDAAFNGKVSQIAYDARTVNNVTTYDVEVMPAQTPPTMRSGMTANVSFVLDARRDVLMIPADAITRRQDRATVLKAPLQKDQKPTVTLIKTGLSDGKHTEVLEGLTEGEKLLVPRLRTTSDTGSSPFSPMRKKR